METQTDAVRCVLCQGGLCLNSGNLHNFKDHLETAHSAVFDLDLLVSIAFLETAEREKIVETVYPRVKKYFQTLRSNLKNTQLTIEKRLLEDLEEDAAKESKKRKLTGSKFASLNEEQEDDSSNRDDVEEAQVPLPETRKKQEDENIPPKVSEETSEEEKVHEARCDICEKPMLRKSIRKHKQRVHQLYDNPRSSIFNINDSVTEDITATEADVLPHVLPQHELEVDDKETPGKQFQSTICCELCFKQISKRNLRRHMRTVHNDRDVIVDLEMAEDHRCKICNERFSVLDTLKDHTKEAHDIDYDNLESCEAQDEDDVQLDDVQLDDSTTGITTESEESMKEYQCDQCDAGYNVKDSLRRHKRKKH